MYILLIIKWSHVDVMRPSLSLGALGEEALPKQLLKAAGGGAQAK